MINGVPWEMTVNVGTLEDLLADPPTHLRSWGHLDWAIAANQALVAALNEVVPYPRDEVWRFMEIEDRGLHKDIILLLPVGPSSDDFYTHFDSQCAGFHFGVIETVCPHWKNDNTYAIATFYSPIPEPATAPLLSLGLIFIAVLRRHRAFDRVRSGLPATTH